ncbi:MAG TPA: nucleotide sugar dehydrogenase [Bacillota bacterium]
MKAVVIGGGVVGTATAVSLTDAGYEVLLLERDDERRARLCRGAAFPDEPDLDQALQAGLREGRLRVGGAVPAGLNGLDHAVFIAVGTPPGGEGGQALDLSQVAGALRQVRASESRGSWKQRVPVVIRSTLPLDAAERLARLGVPVDERVLYVPEFLRVGSALADARHPDRVVVGSADGRVPPSVMPWIRHLQAPVFEMGWDEALLVKLAANALLAVKVSFANELARVAAGVGGDPHRVAAAVAADPRLGPYLRPGVGFGGPCLPKDARAYQQALRRVGLGGSTVSAALQVNDAVGRWVVEDCRSACGDLGGRRVLILGVGFKAGTTDRTASPGVRLAGLLADAGAAVSTVTGTDSDTALSQGDGRDDPLLAEPRPEIVIVAQPDEGYAALNWLAWAEAGGLLVHDAAGILDAPLRTALACRGVRVLGRGADPVLDSHYSLKSL